MLKTENLCVCYGRICALKNVTLHAKRGELTAIIGTNGSGKSTLLKAISGLIRPTSGSIEANNINLLKTPPHKIVSCGISHIPEGRQVFESMTVEDNLLLGGNILKKHELCRQLRKAYESFPILELRSKQLAGTLSGGEQQQLAIARGLMTSPELLLLDEPALGLSPLKTKEIYGIIKRLIKQGTTILLVEQNAYRALELADKAYLLENGKITSSGTGKELLESDAVRRAYLGS